jgi:hypothetical protein
MTVVSELTSQFGVAAACHALAVPRSSFYRSRQAPSPKVDHPPLPARSPRSLSEEEQSVVRETLNSPRFADQAPREVYATLLDEERYLCSWRTMYRILEQNQEVRERRDQLRHPKCAKPELMATSPISYGVGTSPNCWARRREPITSCTSSSTSSVAMSQAGCSPIASRPPWPKNWSAKPASSRGSCRIN